MTSAFFRLGQDLHEGCFVEIFQRRDDRQTADEFRDQAEALQIVRFHLAQDIALAARIGITHVGAKADSRPFATQGDDFLEPRKGTADDEQYVRGVHLQEFLLGMLAAALRRNRGHRAFHDFQQGLLHALARHVARDRGVVGLAADLVDLIDIDDAALGTLDIVVSGLQQLQHDVFQHPRPHNPLRSAWWHQPL